eukprot:Partr_v1_DN27963_c2_g1_i1_m11616 putative Aspartokinase
MSAEWKVMKFGGTSIGNAVRLLQVAEIVKSQLPACRPVVVLSAMSAERKSQGTTARLIAAADNILLPEQREHYEMVDAIERDHMQAVSNSINDLKLRQLCTEEVKSDLQKLRNFFEAAEVIDELSTRSRDVIVGTGEKLSCRVFARVLQSIGVHAVFISLEKIIDFHTAESQLDQRFYDELSVKIARLLIKQSSSTTSNNFIVPVVTGYLGTFPGGILNAVGRGYSDFTAALASAGLRKLGENIDELQIWKEVDGIFTADPRVVPTARLLQSIHPVEAAELTYYGSEVIHPFTMEQVIRTRLAIRIKNTFKPGDAGTLILPDEYESTAHIRPPLHSQELHPFSDILATAVTLKGDVVCLNIHSNRKSVSHGFLARIFTCLDKHGIVVDLISTSEVHVSMALSNSHNNLVSAHPPSSPAAGAVEPKLPAILKDLEGIGEISVLENMAILSLVGKQMKNMVGMSGKMFSAIADQGVNIEMISQGASEINISCVLLESDAVNALKHVHNICVLGKNQ